MPTASVPNTFVAAQPARATEVNANFAALVALLNNGLDASNLAFGAVGENQISDGAVATDKLAEASVTTEKVAWGLSANRIANGTVGNTQFQALSGVASNIQTQLNAKAASSHTHDASAITSGTLPGDRIANGAISTVKLAGGAVDTGQLSDGAVTNIKLAASGLDAGKLTTGTLPIARIANGAVIESKLGPNSVSTAKIQNNAVTADKLAEGAQFTNPIRYTDALVNVASGAVSHLPSGLWFLSTEGTALIVEFYLNALGAWVPLWTGIGAGFVVGANNTLGASQIRVRNTGGSSMAYRRAEIVN